MNKPRVFVSSTCYDLKQIRADLSIFLENMGLDPMLSEASSFPINPDQNTIANCIENVKRADIFLLIVGNRYGSTTEAGRSITNTEYIYAKRRNIPIYVFLDKELSTILKVWKKNKDINLTEIVDSEKVLEFADTLLNEDKQWCFNFEYAKDITTTLTAQLGNLFKSALDIRHKYSLTKEPGYFKYLSPSATNILLLKEEMYEAFFFAQVLEDELKKYEDVKLEWDYDIRYPVNREVSLITELIDWLKVELNAVSQTALSLNNLLNQAFKDFRATAETATDFNGIYLTAKAIAKIFHSLLVNSINIKSTIVGEDFIKIKDLFSKMTKPVIEDIWKYPQHIRNLINSGLEEIARTGEDIKVSAELTLRMDETFNQDFDKALAELESSKRK